jgi:hypothetical protein
MECVARDAGVDLNGSRSAASADRELASATRLSNQSMSSCSWTIVPRAPRRSRFKFVTLASAGHGPRAHFQSSEPCACSITQAPARAETSERAAQLQLQLLAICRLEMRPLRPSVQPASQPPCRLPLGFSQRGNIAVEGQRRGLSHHIDTMDGTRWTDVKLQVQVSSDTQTQTRPSSRPQPPLLDTRLAPHSTHSSRHHLLCCSALVLRWLTAAVAALVRRVHADRIRR